MPATNAPFGLEPIRHASGQVLFETAQIAGAYASAIYKNSPIKFLDDGTIGIAVSGDAFVGSFQGCKFTDATGRPRMENHWPAGQTIMTGTTVEAFITRDPGVIYRIQADGPMEQTDIGNCADFTVLADDTGSTATGLSTATMMAASSTTMQQLQIVGFEPGPHNAFADAFPIALVMIAEHQLRAVAAAGI